MKNIPEYNSEQIANFFLKGKSNRFSITKDKSALDFIHNKMDKVGLPLKETVYCYINDIYPPMCRVCNKNTPAFISFNVGFREYCSTSCQASGERSNRNQTLHNNIQDLVKDLNVEEIVSALYHKTLSIQYYRSIEKLSRLPKFNSLEQMYNHVVLRESQICGYCGSVYGIDPSNNQLRKCNCNTQQARLVEQFLLTNYSKTELLNFIVVNELYRDGVKESVKNKIKFSYYKECIIFNENISFSERIYLDYNNIDIKPDREYLNFKLGYKELPFDIFFSENSFLQNIDLLKWKYSDKGLYSAREAIEYCSGFLGRSTKETIHLQEVNQKYIPLCSSKGCLNFRKYISHQQRYLILCQVCIGKKSKCISLAEKEILLFVKEICPDEEILENYRGFGKEFDIYLPNKNLAIEFNGLYWHSSKFKDSKYHLCKTKLAEDNNVQLLHIFEHEWDKKQEIVKSIISAKLGLLSTRIFARKCAIKTVSSAESNLFLDSNHIQGKDNAPIRYGLYYNDDLVSIMTFKRSHRSKNKYMELKRYCSLINHSVVGGFPKLLKYARNIINEDIVSFGDRRFTYKNNVYESSGFELDSISPVNYFYYVNGEVRGREQFQKHLLKNKLAKFNEKISAKKNMHINGLFEIYDSGNYKYILKYQK